MTRGPLDGLKVLEVGGIGPGPHAGMLLADLGASVLRVERPHGGLQVVPDRDRDFLPASLEAFYGSRDDSRDSDGDGLDDRFESLIGWDVAIPGRGILRVTSNPGRADTTARTNPRSCVDARAPTSSSDTIVHNTADRAATAWMRFAGASSAAGTASTRSSRRRTANGRGRSMKRAARSRSPSVSPPRERPACTSSDRISSSEQGR